MGRARRPRRRALALGWGVLTPALLALVGLPEDPTAEAGIEAPGRSVAPLPGVARDLDRALSGAETLASKLESEGLEMETFYRTEVQPLVGSLVRLRDDPGHARRIAAALVREGRRTGVDPRLLLAVMTVENPWLELGALSPVGAVGLMQVMPFHAGAWGCEGEDLTDLDVNICHGSRILAHALREADGDLDRALLRYNGCVRGTNTPDCHLYPFWVLRNAGLAWLSGPHVPLGGIPSSTATEGLRY